MNHVRKLALAGAVIGLLAGCSSPVAKINQSCRASGGTAAACDCFTTQLQNTMTPEQLNALAASMDQSRQQNPEAAQAAALAMQQQLGVEGTIQVAGAAKQCQVNTMQGL